MKTNTTSIATKKNAATKGATATATVKSDAVARRALNQNVEVEQGIAMPSRDHKSKYPFAKLVNVGDSFFLEDCRSGNAAAIKTTAKSKFNMHLIARPGQKEIGGVMKDGYRFWLKERIGVADAANLAAAAQAENKDAADATQAA